MPPINQPLLLDLPEQFETERLILRAPRPGDGAMMYQTIMESLEWLKPWMPWAHNQPSIENSESLCRRMAALYRLREDFMLLITERESGRLLGGSGMHRINWNLPSVELGYWIHPNAAGKGYVTEAVHKITNVAFEHLHAERVEIRMDSDNVASYAVAERCGFRREAHLRHEGRKPDGSLRDTLIYSKLRSEWQPEESDHA